MLSIGKLGIGQERYYLYKVAEGAEDYYSVEGEVAGQWMGDAAEELGLYGEVTPDQLKAMLAGRNPVDGVPLLGRQGVPGKGSVPGFDLTSLLPSPSPCSGVSAALMPRLNSTRPTAPP
jgi:conjugative relaxase-like TrwC/TraI family protein